MKTVKLMEHHPEGLEARYGEDPYETQKDYSLNRLAEIVEENLDMDIIDKLIFD